jgi:hypothetical protein
MTVLNFFLPNRQYIENISNSNPAVVTTTQPHGYDSTLVVRLFFPPGYNFGMTQLINDLFQITVLSNVTFSIPVNTTSFDPFVIPPDPKQLPQVIPAAEVGSTLSEAVRNNGTISPEL